jgi:multidrug efflux system membrane fusion protein
MLLALGTALGIAACDGKEVKGQSGPGGGPGGGRGAARPIVITAAPVAQKPAPVQIAGLIGTVEPIQSVTIKARIGGQIEKVHFTEGQDVKQGDRLFTIDRRPLEMELAQAEANLKRDEAQAENARNEAKRYNDLNKRNAVAAADYDKIQTAARALEATVAAERAAVASAKLQLEYTEITAPITGRTGSLVVDAGNIVKVNDSDLVTINQLSPIYVLFSVDENRLPQIRRAMANHELTVTATIPNDNGPAEEGKLTFINNTVTVGRGRSSSAGRSPTRTTGCGPGSSSPCCWSLKLRKMRLFVRQARCRPARTGRSLS